jgi:hypothetical protein
MLAAASALYRPVIVADRTEAPIHPEGSMDQFAVFAAQQAPYFVGWGTLSLINAGLAQGKNRSGLVWFLVSLLLGPIGTLIVVLLPRQRERLF